MSGLKEEISQTKEDYKFMISLEAEFKRDNWKTTKKKTTTLGVAKIPNTPTVTCLCEETMEIDVVQCIAVYNEANLYNKWIPNVSKSGMYKRKSLKRNE